MRQYLLHCLCVPVRVCVRVAQHHDGHLLLRHGNLKPPVTSGFTSRFFLHCSKIGIVIGIITIMMHDDDRSGFHLASGPTLGPTLSRSRSESLVGLGVRLADGVSQAARPGPLAV